MNAYLVSQTLLHICEYYCLTIVNYSQMKEEGPMLGERGLEAAEKYSTAFLNRSTLSSIRDCKGRKQSITLTTYHAGIVTALCAE